MGKIKNLSLRKTIVLYMIISLIISFYLSALIMRIASTVQNNIWWNYVDQEEYFEMAEGDGRRYLPDVPRPHSYEMKEFDYHVSEICDFLQTFTVLIVSVAGSIIAVFLFYKHKLKCPIEELELASRQVGRNNLDFHITYENEDEMGGLCKEFERMRGQLAENNQQLWKMLEEEKALRAAIAHDIRSPLSVLEGYQEMLSEYLPKKEINMEQALEMVNESKKQIERMDIFVETMRKMSSLDTRELVAEEITSKQVEIDVRAEMNVFRKKFGKLYELECSETEEKFSGDKEVILEVIVNLLSNAFRYAKTKVEMEVFLTCSELQIRIKDDGVGFTIDKQKATELFSRRPLPDYENSIKESISAVEAVCSIITGLSGKNATLGKTIKKLKDYGVHIHPSMENAFSSMYGYTSDEDGIRHGGIDFKWAPAEDAKYMLVSCSAFVNYLIEKWSKAAKNQDNSEV